jgi:hypothetical protein
MAEGDQQLGEVLDPQQFKMKDAMVTVQNISIAPPPMVRLNLGSIQSFSRVFQNEAVVKKILGIVWNEDMIGLITSDRSTVIKFRPEIDPSVKQFMDRPNNRRMTEDGDDFNVWKGNFVPVEFSKSDLIKFLKERIQDSNLPVEVIEKIKA